MLDQRFAEQADILKGMVQKSKVEILDAMNARFEEFRLSYAALSKKVQVLEAAVQRITEKETEIDTYLSSLSNVNAELQLLHDKVAKHENALVACELRIHGVPAQDGENLEQSFYKLCSAADIAKPVIQSIRRLKQMHNNKITDGAIIVKLATPQMRNNILRSLAEFRKRTPKQQLSLQHMGYNSTASIFVNEQLTQNNHQILNSANRMKKQKHNPIQSVFTRRGIVNIVLHEHEGAIQIYSLTQLHELSKPDATTNDNASPDAA